MKIYHLILVIIFCTCINGKFVHDSNSLDFEHHILPRPSPHFRPSKAIESEEQEEMDDMEAPKDAKIESAKLVSLMVSFDDNVKLRSSYFTFPEKNYLVEYKEAKK